MSGKKQGLQYYSLDRILKEKAQYNIIFGERSNGKSYSALLYGLENFFKKGKQFAIVRRFDDDIKQSKGETFFDAIIADGHIFRLSGGKYTGIKYRSRKFYLCFHDDEIEKDIVDNKPFAYAFAINVATRYKSTSYPDITTIVFDEFLEREIYLQNEFVSFMSIVSTIVRSRNDVKIFMLGNTVNQHCPYFTEMGLKDIRNMKQGSIAVYKYGDSALKVAVEYCANLNKGKPSDTYFAFNNPKLEMITGGVWEMARYPHLPVKYKPKEVVFTYFIDFDGALLQCEIVETGDTVFTYIHRKTTPIQDPDNDVVYTLEYSNRPNYVRRLLKPITPWQKKIAYFFAGEKVFYQDNEVGEIVRNYLNASSRDKIT